MIFSVLSMTDDNWERLKQKMMEAAPAFAQKVAPAYQALNWNWFYLESYPTEDQIREHIVELIDKLSHDILSISSGGIKVSIEEEEGFPIGRLAMEIETEMSL